MLLTITWILSLITSWLFPVSIFAVIAGIIADLLKKRFYWSKFALIFFVITIILLVIQIKLIYRITGDTLNNSSNETASTEATQTANWKTYINTKYTFQYPSDWIVTEGDAKTADHSKNTTQILNKSGSVKINISDEQPIYGFSCCLESEYLSVNINGQNYQVKETTFGNHAVFVDFQIGKSKYHVLFGTGYPAGDNRLASISDYNLAKETILKILSTFKLTDQTSNWKTYIDSNFGYSFKYPADYKPYFKNGNVFYSSDAKFDKITTAKTSGIDIGSTVYGPGEDTQEYIGPNTKMDSILSSKLVLPSEYSAKAYVNLEDITVTIDYKKSNKNMRLILWCGGEKGNSSGCENVLTPLLSTFKFLDQNTEGQFCGGIAGKICPEGYKCQLDGSYPDAGGKCVKE